jgi:hypothetical protein
MNLFRRAIDGLIAGADEELAIARPVRMSGGAWGRALGGAGGRRRAVLRSTAARVANRFKERSYF